MKKVILPISVFLIFCSLAFAQKFPNDPLTLKLLKEIKGTLIKVKDDRCGDAVSIKVSSIDKALDKINTFFISRGYLKNDQQQYTGYISLVGKDYMFFVGFSNILCMTAS